jgi:hypothetical protein
MASPLRVLKCMAAPVGSGEGLGRADYIRGRGNPTQQKAPCPSRKAESLALQANEIRSKAFFATVSRGASAERTARLSPAREFGERGFGKSDT